MARLRILGRVCAWTASLLAIGGDGGLLRGSSSDCLASSMTSGQVHDCLQAFLEGAMPSWDADNLGSLRRGILEDTIALALQARSEYAWAADVPWPIWSNWVLPYASVNEPRNSWRRLLQERLEDAAEELSASNATLREVVEEVNRKLWTVVREGKPVVFRHHQTPVVYDPMSTIAYGYASCTGISLLLVDGLRTLGVPARLVGTPAWNGNASAGNHNWVEVWLGEEAGWAFMEGLPAGGGSLDDPCTKWYCSAAKMSNGTEVFAAQFDRITNDSVYPMSWDPSNLQVPGLNRTAYYRSACARCRR